jgi:hypothetical protein
VEVSLWLHAPTVPPPLPSGKERRYLLNVMLGGPQRENLEDNKCLLLPTGIERRLLRQLSVLYRSRCTDWYMFSAESKVPRRAPIQKSKQNYRCMLAIYMLN